MKYHEIEVEGYERVVEAIDESGFRAIVGIHNTNRGVALGGCRVMPYESRDAQLQDALNLSKGMTYKAALAGLSLGGGKATINAPVADKDTLQKFAEVMEYINLDGTQYITAGDVGTGPKEVQLLSTLTPYVNGQHLGEDSGYATAYGVYMAMLGALEFHNRDLRKQFISVEGLGKVGARLVKFIHNEADSVFTYDPRKEVGDDIFHRFAAVPVRSRDALIRYGTVYSPNALGGGLDAETMKVLVPGDIVCGGANNQFANSGLNCVGQEMDVAYAACGITVVPDFLANAGGIIIVKEGMKDASYMDSDVMDKLKQIKFTTEEVLWRARDEKYSPMHIAKVMAEERFK